MKISTDHLPLRRGVGHFDEFALAIAVDESGSLEGLDLGVDQGHGGFLVVKFYSERREV